MFLGHFAVALAAKPAARKVNLGWLVVGGQFADLLWPALLLAGVERVRIVPGLLAASPFDFLRYPISHSLLTLSGFGILLGLVYFAARRDGRGAVVLGLLVPSHWLLDWLMHRPDLPLTPWAGAKFGLGAWRSIPLTLALEFGLLAAGLVVYVRSAPARDRIGRWAFWALVAFLVVSYVGSVFGPPPSSWEMVAYAAPSMWLLVLWAWWADRHRGAAAAGDAS